MWQVGDRLHHPAITDRGDFAQRDRKSHGKGYRDQEFTEADDQCVGQQLTEVRGIEELQEVLVPRIRPGTVDDSLADRKILK